MPPEPSLPPHSAVKKERDTGIPAGGLGSNAQTGMSVSLTQVTRRNLPHWRRDGSIYWVTFRLADSLPQSKLAQLRSEQEAWLRRNPEPWTHEQQRDHEARFGERVQQWLDAGYGSCALGRADVRGVVRACLIRFDGERLRLHAAVIMPNHVHALIEPCGERECDTGIPAGGSGSVSEAQTGMSVSPASPAPLSRLLKGIKGASARAANQLLGRTGAFWMDESYDRIVRNRDEYRRFVDYIRANPAKAALHADHYWLYCRGDTGIPAGGLDIAQARMDFPHSASPPSSGS